MALWDEDFTGKPRGSYPGPFSGPGISQWKILRGTHDFGATEDSEVVAFSEPLNAANSFVRLSNNMNVSGGDAVGTNQPRYTNDIGATIHSVDASGFTVEREAGAVNVDVRIAYEAWQGPFTKLLDQEIEMLGGTRTFTTQISSFTDINQCVPVLTGQRTDVTFKYATNRLMHRTWISGTSSLKVRTRNGEDTRRATIAVIEFPSNYTVSKYDHVFSAGGVTETETITDVVDTSKCFIFSSFQSGATEVAAGGYLVWFANSTTVNFKLSSLHNNPANESICTIYIVKNDDLNVVHSNSVDSGGTFPPGIADPQTLETSASAVSSLSGAAVLGWASTDIVDANGSMGNWNYAFKSVTDQDWVRAEHGGSADWALSVIDFASVPDVFTAVDDAYSANANVSATLLLSVLSNDLYNGAGTLEIDKITTAPSFAGSSAIIVDENGNTATAAPQTKTHILYRNPLRKRGVDTITYRLTDDGGTTLSNTATITLTIFSQGNADPTARHTIGGGISTVTEF